MKLSRVVIAKEKTKAMRVHEIAKQFHITSRELLEVLKKAGVTAYKTASSGLSEEEVACVRDYLKAPGYVKKPKRRAVAGAAVPVKPRHAPKAKKVPKEKRPVRAKRLPKAAVKQAKARRTPEVPPEPRAEQAVHAPPKAPAPPKPPKPGKPRPPVVTIMGHVDHGKTTLLDAIRSSRITAKEKGGLTQHIGAYRVHTEHGDIIFLDTPGHESFTAMRSRGGKAADIVVLVVAADDGVMPQTIESINHCRVAKVPIIVAINKIDLPGADPDAVKNQLAQYDVAPNIWEEPIDFEEISAKEKVGIDEILERILILAEMMELKADPEGPASGLVIESRLDPRRGRLATLLVQEGTLRIGDIIVAGASSGKIRAMMDDRGQQVKEAGPSVPVEVLGLTENLPSAGDLFHVCCSGTEARENALKSAKAPARSTEVHRASLEELAVQAQTKGPQEFKIILKTDVSGSLEAIEDLLGRIKNPEVKLEIVHEGVGQVTDSDVLLAQISNCCIVGFNVPVMPSARNLAKRNNINIYTYDVIYRLQEEIEQAMQGILKPHKKENIVGTAQVRRLFHVPKIGVVLGCSVSSGKIVRNLRARVIREGEIKGTGKITSLKHFKQDVREIKQGMECGIVVEGVKDIHPDDIIEEFEIVEIPAGS